MIFIEAQQGTDAWHQARVGKITASCFADAVSRVGELDERQAKYARLVLSGIPPSDAMKEAGYKAAPSSEGIKRALKGEDPSEPSDTAKRYAADLAIERISMHQHGEPAKAWVLDRGHEMEARARMLYEARTGAFITEAGICVSDDGIFGYSTDGLSEDDGLIEIKAPIDSIKIMDMWRTGDTSEYDHQIHGGLWLTGRRWLDFIMYTPELANVGKDLYVKRIYRDDAFIDAMVEKLVAFESMVTDAVQFWRSADPQTTTEGSMELMPQEAALQETQPAIVECISAETMDAVRVDTDISEVATIATPALRLGQIGQRLGFDVRADFLLSLGFAPAATDKAAKLYHEHDFKNICAALIRHVGAVQAQF